MSYNAIICKIKNVKKHSNADRLQIGVCCGSQVIVGLEVKEGDLGVYFPTDGQLSEEFVVANNLYKRMVEVEEYVSGNPNPVIVRKNTGGMFDENRRVRTQKLRGEKSDGFWMPAECLQYLSTATFEKDIDHVHLGIAVLREGDEFDSIGNHPICNKYISPSTRQFIKGTGQPKKKKRGSIMFKEHFDTSHMVRNLHKIEDGDKLIITEKVHGTSQRLGYVKVGHKTSLWWDICAFLATGIWSRNTETFEWEYMNGTRRVVLDNSYAAGTGFHEDGLRSLATKPFIGKLNKGETVYFEVVGFEPSGKAIMGSVDTSKMNDKEFTKNWANDPDKKSMVYSYGCGPNQSKVYVYRMTMTNEDGFSVDYSWEDVKKRCEEMEVNAVPELFSFNYQKPEEGQEDRLLKVIEMLSAGCSKLDISHIREGVCVRVEKSGINLQVYKHKSFEFKVLEGIVKDAGVVDLEEAS